MLVLGCPVLKEWVPCANKGVPCVLFRDRRSLQVQSHCHNDLCRDAKALLDFSCDLYRDGTSPLDLPCDLCRTRVIVPMTCAEMGKHYLIIPVTFTEM